MAFNDCERCGTDSLKVDVQEVVLRGDLRASLCTKCRNEWGDYVRAMPVEEELAALEAREARLRALAIAQQPPSEEDFAALIAEGRRLNAIYLLAAKAFVKPVTT